jgi:hypothetical protein
VPVNFAVRHAPSGGWEQQQSSMKMLQLQAADEELLLPDDITQVRAATSMHPSLLRTLCCAPVCMPHAPAVHEQQKLSYSRCLLSRRCCQTA